MYKILIIEDETAFRNLLKQEFESQRFEVVAVADSKAGLIAATKKVPDFILLDLMMPGMNGTDFLQHASDFLDLERIPIAITTVVPEGVPQKFHDQKLFKNVIGYWVKSELTPTQIVLRVQEYLNKKA